MIENNAAPSTLTRIIRKFERCIVVALVAMMMIVITLATLDLAWLIIKDVYTPPIFLLEVDELLELFGFFLLIIIGVELLETIKGYLRDNVIHIEIVLEVALIAIARKVIVLDLSKYDGVSVLAVAALILALAVASMLRRRARRSQPASSPDAPLFIPPSMDLPSSTPPSSTSTSPNPNSPSADKVQALAG